MTPDVMHQALRATARVACTTALTGCVLGAKQNPEPDPESNASDTDAVNSDSDTDADSDADDTDTDTDVDTDTDPPVLTEEECRVHVTEVFTNQTEPVSQTTYGCCSTIIESYEQLDTGENPWDWAELQDCCELLGWPVSIACTPWGPPAPPAMV